MSEYTAKDFKKGQPRWCPGCVDVLEPLGCSRGIPEVGVRVAVTTSS